jgi:hypothetical protein
VVLDRVAGQYFRALAGRADGLRGALRPSRGLVLLLLACLLALSVLPYASPSDPLWLRGVYDGADYDELVTLLSDTVAVGASAPVTVKRFRLVLTVAPFRSASALRSAALLGFHLRSPPSA